MLFRLMFQYVINKNSGFLWMTGQEAGERREGGLAAEHQIVFCPHFAIKLLIVSKMFLRIYLHRFATIPAFPQSQNLQKEKRWDFLVDARINIWFISWKIPQSANMLGVWLWATRAIQWELLDSNKTSQISRWQEKETFGEKGNACLFLCYSIFLGEAVQTTLWKYNFQKTLAIRSSLGMLWLESLLNGIIFSL